MGNKIWLKRVLIPLWVIQLIVAVIVLGASAVDLWAVNSAQDNGDLANVDHEAKSNLAKGA